MHDKPFYRTRFAVLKPNGYGMLRAKLVADHVGRTSLDMEPTEGMHVSSHMMVPILLQSVPVSVLCRWARRPALRFQLVSLFGVSVPEWYFSGRK